MLHTCWVNLKIQRMCFNYKLKLIQDRHKANNPFSRSDNVIFFISRAEHQRSTTSNQWPGSCSNALIHMSELIWPCPLNVIILTYRPLFSQFTTFILQNNSYKTHIFLILTWSLCFEVYILPFVCVKRDLRISCCLM